MKLEIQISAGGNSPIFRQIVDQIRLAIVTKRLAVGEQLPSVRALAERLVINPNTVARAYADLARDGVIDTRQGRGMFVASPRQIYTKAERQRRIEPLIESLVSQAMSLGISSGELIASIQAGLEKLEQSAATVRQGTTS